MMGYLSTCVCLASPTGSRSSCKRRISPTIRPVPQAVGSVPLSHGQVSREERCHTAEASAHGHYTCRKKHGLYRNTLFSDMQ